MPDTNLVVRMTTQELEALDKVAAEKGYSRSELVRLILRQGVAFARNFSPKDRAATIRPGAEVPA